MIQRITLLVVALVGGMAVAELPGPPEEYVDFPMSWTADAPGVVDASALLPKPAGAMGPVVVREGHFYTGEKRFRIWGVNFAFGANFPTHEQADGVARRLSRFGINAVRLHHMDSQPFPNGIFADRKLEALSGEALDRLDYLVAALARQGVYVDINLHVSRTWSKAHGWENAEKLPENDDKMLDVFHPELIAANKQYARDLLTHVNAYTKNRYADEPSVCVVEINNEDTLFLWGGEAALAKLPEPYAGMLKKNWNEWLVKKYGSREKLAAAWRSGEQPLGPNLLSGDLAKVGRVEQHEKAKVTGSAAALADGSPAMKFGVRAVDGTSWHAQWTWGGVALQKGKAYTVSFTAKADEPTDVGATVAMAHEPWGNLGLGTTVKVGKEEKAYSLGFTASGDDSNGRLSFAVGQSVNVVTIGKIELREGGRLGLREGEDPAAGTVAANLPGRSDTAARSVDWFDFLQQTDEAYWVGMRDFLKNEIGVKAPITGTIGLGPLGTLSQSKMDFVDAHSYWDHPKFPHRPWDPGDWTENNKPMVDKPAGATLWGLAATRVAGKPFTVTEYNHAAPNEWQAECIPTIAAYAALQDWDGVFLFAYSHADQYDKGKMASFFDVEGNPLKMPLMPIGARIFLGGAVKPMAAKVVAADRGRMLQTGSKYYYNQWPFVRDELKVKWEDAFGSALAVSFDGQTAAGGRDERVEWIASGGDGNGMLAVNDPSFVARVGFVTGKLPLKMGPLKIARCDSPFASFVLTPAEAGKTLEESKRLLLAVVGRGENTGMKWDAGRHTVGTQWGNAPARIEVVKAMVKVPVGWKVIALKADGTRGEEIAADGGMVDLGKGKTVWFEITRQ